MPASHTLHAHVPWGSGNSNAGESAHELAPRQAVAFTCPKGHHFTKNFAAEAKPPDAFDCRCGGVALRDGAPEDTPRRVELPGLRSGGGAPKHTHAADVTPRAQLFKRRTPAQLDQILAERLAEVRQSGVAR